MMTQSTTQTTRIAVLTLRRRVGASSCLSQPIQSESVGRASRNVALIWLACLICRASVPGAETFYRNALQLMCSAHSFRRRTFDDRDRGRAHTEKILVRI